MMPNKGESLVGYYFLLDNGEHYRTGRIRDIIAHGNESVPAIYLLEYDEKIGRYPMPLELVSIAEMLDACEHGIKRYNLFSTKVERDAWVEWVNSPEDGESEDSSSDCSPKVVPMLPNKYKRDPKKDH